MQRPITPPARQRGAILIVSLLLLLVMTVLALTASQTTRLQERMAGNARDMDLAFQAGEAGLRAAEKSLEDTADSSGRGLIKRCATLSEDCPVLERSTESLDYAHSDADWWTDNAVSYGDPEIQEFDDLKTDPLTRTELWAEKGDTVTDDGKPKTGTAYYVITSRALGGTETAETVVQSVFASPYVIAE